jgi:hypothetical protein
MSAWSASATRISSPWCRTATSSFCATAWADIPAAISPAAWPPKKSSAPSPTRLRPPPSATSTEIAALEPFAPLLVGVFAADQALRAYGRKHSQFQGMGTTLAALQEHAGMLCAVHVGDSRVYCFRDGHLVQLTQDHSYVATLPESARASFAGIRNILTRAIGVGDELEVDFTIAAAEPEELYLLCTDGLHNFVSEERIAEVLAPDRS